MKIFKSNRRILKLPCWKSTSKKISSSFHEIQEIITFKHQSFVFGGMSTMNFFFTPKLMKIRWSSPFFESFAIHFKIKLGKHGSNLNSVFVIMSEPKFFLLMGS
jgi:hypothetical protein